MPKRLLDEILIVLLRIAEHRGTIHDFYARMYKFSYSPDEIESLIEKAIQSKYVGISGEKLYLGDKGSEEIRRIEKGFDKDSIRGSVYGSSSTNRLHNLVYPSMPRFGMRGIPIDGTKVKTCDSGCKDGLEVDSQRKGDEPAGMGQDYKDTAVSELEKNARMGISQAIEKAKSLVQDNLLSQEDYQTLVTQMDTSDHYPFSMALMESGISVRTGKLADVNIVDPPASDDFGKHQDLSWEESFPQSELLQDQSGQNDRHPSHLDRKISEDEIPGGLADEAEESDFDPGQVEKGIRVELEHTDDPAVAKEIVMDHLTENPKYYDYLEDMEESWKEAQVKKSKDEVQYKEYAPHSQCIDCSFFKIGSGGPYSQGLCEKVDGEVNPSGWCLLWDFRGIKSSKKKQGQDLKELAFSFLQDNPDPPDSVVHEFAEANDIPVDDLEAAIYSIATDCAESEKSEKVADSNLNNAIELLRIWQNKADLERAKEIAQSGGLPLSDLDKAIELWDDFQSGGSDPTSTISNLIDKSIKKLEDEVRSRDLAKLGQYDFETKFRSVILDFAKSRMKPFTRQDWEQLQDLYVELVSMSSRIVWTQSVKSALDRLDSALNSKNEEEAKQGLAGLWRKREDISGAVKLQPIWENPSSYVVDSPYGKGHSIEKDGPMIYADYGEVIYEPGAPGREGIPSQILKDFTFRRKGERIIAQPFDTVGRTVWVYKDDGSREAGTILGWGTGPRSWYYKVKLENGREVEVHERLLKNRVATFNTKAQSWVATTYATIKNALDDLKKRGFKLIRKQWTKAGPEFVLENSWGNKLYLMESGAKIVKRTGSLWNKEASKKIAGMVSSAEKELQRAGLFDEDSDYNGMIGKAVLDLVKLFSDQGHSGFSAMLTLEVFNTVASFKPLTPLTSEPDEWMDVGEGLWQNTRDPETFSEDGGKTWYSLSDKEAQVVDGLVDSATEDAITDMKDELKLEDTVKTARDKLRTAMQGIIPGVETPPKSPKSEMDRMPESYSNENQFEDADMKIGFVTMAQLDLFNDDFSRDVIKMLEHAVSEEGIVEYLMGKGLSKEQAQLEIAEIRSRWAEKEALKSMGPVDSVEGDDKPSEIKTYTPQGITQAEK